MEHEPTTTPTKMVRYMRPYTEDEVVAVSNRIAAALDDVPQFVGLTALLFELVVQLRATDEERADPFTTIHVHTPDVITRLRPLLEEAAGLFAMVCQEGLEQQEVIS